MGNQRSITISLTASKKDHPPVFLPSHIDRLEVLTGAEI